MESTEAQRQLANLGWGLVQVNLRLARMTELLEQARRRDETRARRREPSVTVPAPPLGPAHPVAAISAFSPPQPARLGPPVHVGADGTALPDPAEVLGLPARYDEDTVRAAFRAALEAHPPEQDPDGALRVREARDRLFDPARWLERELGVPQAPDREAWGLTSTLAAAGPARLDAEARLTGQAVLYALVEDDLWERGLAEASALPRRG